MTPDRRDGNERAIIDALRRSGAWVRQMSREAGFDLLVIHHGKVFLMEVKQVDGRLTANERITKSDVEQAGAEYLIIRSAEDALDAVIGVVA